MSKLLALDQAFRVTGYAIFDDSELVKVGHFTMDNSDDGIRLHQIRQKIQSLIQENEITEIVFEDIYMDGGKVNNVATHKKLAAVWGIVYELGVDLGLPITTVLATTWKAGIKLQGRSRTDQKRNAKQFILDTYNIKVTEDEADAACIGTYYLKFEKSAF